jgi:hypothetical protein
MVRAYSCATRYQQAVDLFFCSLRCRRTACNQVDELAWAIRLQEVEDGIRATPLKLRRRAGPIAAANPNLNPSRRAAPSSPGPRQLKPAGAGSKKITALLASVRVEIIHEVWDTLATAASRHCHLHVVVLLVDMVCSAHAPSSHLVPERVPRNRETMLMMTTVPATSSRPSPRRRHPGTRFAAPTRSHAAAPCRVACRQQIALAPSLIF